jgi:hypothetical protein
VIVDQGPAIQHLFGSFGRGHPDSLLSSLGEARHAISAACGMIERKRALPIKSGRGVCPLLAVSRHVAATGQSDAAQDALSRDD